MSKTLLLADDSVTIQKVVGLSFANEDVSLVTVDNGDDAIARTRTLRPDVVLADVVMPGKNGYEVCEAIKSDPGLRHIPVLLLTGTFEAFDEERARRVGADGHITKPFEAQALVDTVTALIARAPSAAPQPVAPAPIAAPVAVPAPSVTAAPVTPSATPAPATLASPGVLRVGEESYDFFDDDLLEEAALTAETQVARDPIELGAAPATVLAEADAFDLGDDEGALDLAEAEVEVEAELPAPSFPVPAAEPSMGWSARSDATVALVSERGAPAAAQAPIALDYELTSFELTETAPDPVSADDLFESAGMFESEIEPASVALDALEEPAAVPLALATIDDEPFDLGLDLPTAPGTDARGRDPLASLDPRDMARATVLDPTSSRDFDVSWSDLGRPLGGPALDARIAGEEAEPALLEPAFSDHTPTAPSMPLPQATVLMEEEPRFEDPEPAALTRPPGGSFSEPPPTATAVASTALPDVSPVLRERIHDMLEKVAWEAFSDLSDTIVRQALERIEAIAWEVIPQMAEALVREEIRRLKGDGDDA